MRLSLLAATAVAIALALPALASEPGQFMDCSDMVFHVAGLTCTELPIAGEQDEVWWRGSNLVVDNQGGWLYVRNNTEGPFTLEVRRRDSAGDSLLTSITARASPYGWDGAEHRRADDGNSSGRMSVAAGLEFDPTGGRLLVRVLSQSNTPSGNTASRWWIAVIEGFTTTFDILQTYTPTSGPLSFRVPYLPSGLPAADYFDTYYGDLATVGDWSQAQPLQCGYPATPPSVGDYLTVEDTLPTPIPGTGRYYVTAVTHQGQRRFGRQYQHGVLSGRDPIVLPACE